MFPAAIAELNGKSITLNSVAVGQLRFVTIEPSDPYLTFVREAADVDFGYLSGYQDNFGSWVLADGVVSLSGFDSGPSVVSLEVFQ